VANRSEQALQLEETEMTFANSWTLPDFTLRSLADLLKSMSVDS